MELKNQILNVMKQENKPLSGGDIEKALGVDRKAIDKAMNELKKENLIESPIRCKWQPK